jgi:DNA-directed RNA polymerase specialized sigma24 family protein
LEIARVLDRRPSSIRVMLFRARARLADSVESEAGEQDPPSSTVQIQIAGDSR